VLKGIRHLIMTKFVCALAAVSLTATATSQTKPSGQRSLADDVVLQFVSVGVDPVPVLGALPECVRPTVRREWYCRHLWVH
jgi:hypothetical protein